MATNPIEITTTEWRKLTAAGDSGTCWKKTGGTVVVCSTDQEDALFLSLSNLNVTLSRSKRVPLDEDSGKVLQLFPVSSDDVFYGLSTDDPAQIVVDAANKIILPFLDTFTDVNGTLLENHIPDSENFTWDVVNGTWKIKDNKAQNNPGLGVELITNGTAWTGATGATPPNGWDVGLAGVFTIFDSGDGVPHDVSLKIEVNATPTANPYIAYGFTTEIGELCKLSYAFKHGTGNNGRVNIGSAFGSDNILASGPLTDATWTTYTKYFYATTTTTWILLQTQSSTIGQYELFDTVTAKQVTRNETFATDDLGIIEGIFDVDVTIPTANDGHAGLVLALDSANSPANWIEVFYNRGTGKVEVAKFVAGSRTSLINTTATYAAGASPQTELTISGSDLLVDVIYNGNTIGTQQRISNAGIVGNRRHGTMNVSPNNSLDNFRVDPN